jgi:hypothetical protein
LFVLEFKKSMKVAGIRSIVEWTPDLRRTDCGAFVSYVQIKPRQCDLLGPYPWVWREGAVA